MGITVTAQTLERIKANPQAHAVLLELWERSFGGNISVTQVQEKLVESNLIDTGNEDIEFVISSIRLNIGSQQYPINLKSDLEVIQNVQNTLQTYASMFRSGSAIPTGRARRTMTYIVNDACIKCKYTDCVEVCPQLVDCFYDAGTMLVINPEECIDCGVCEPECPAGAIKADTNMSEELEFFLQYSIEQSKDKEPVTKATDPYPDADDLNPVLNTSIGNKRHLL